MVKVYTYLVVLAGLVLHINYGIAQGYEIKVKIPALKDSSVIMGHYVAKPGAFYADDTAVISKSGVAVLKGKNTLQKGIYIILLPSKKFFEFMMGSDQVFTIEADTSELDNPKFIGSDDNTLFYEYRKYVTKRSTEANQLMEQKKKATTKSTKDSLTKAFDKINQEVLTYMSNLKSAHKDLYLVKFISAIDEVKIPDFPRDANGNVLDSTFQYKYFKAHYFDNFNYADPDLYRTPLYEQKVKTYFENMVAPMPDSINMELDKMLTKVQNHEELFRYILGTFYLKYGNSQIMGQDAIFVHLAEEWYLKKATWVDSTFKANLRKDIAKIKPNLINSIAPNIPLVELPYDHFMAAKMDTAMRRNINVGFYTKLTDYKAKYLVVAFWESDCGHCKKIIPQLYETYQRIKDKGVQVVAIHTVTSEEGKMKWVDFVNDHSMYEWHNAWAPTSHAFRDLYNIYSTPVIYILDKDKKIMAKRVSPEQVEEIITIESKKENK